MWHSHFFYRSSWARGWISELQPRLDRGPFRQPVEGLYLQSCLSNLTKVAQNQGILLCRLFWSLSEGMQNGGATDRGSTYIFEICWLAIVIIRSRIFEFWPWYLAMWGQTQLFTCAYSAKVCLWSKKAVKRRILTFRRKFRHSASF